jgi:hypothetical protein
VVGRHGKEVEAGVDQLVDHPCRRAEMRSPAFEGRVADEVVRQYLQVREGDVSAADEVEERPQGGVPARQQPSLDDAVSRQGKPKHRGSRHEPSLSPVTPEHAPDVQGPCPCPFAAPKVVTLNSSNDPRPALPGNVAAWKLRYQRNLWNRADEKPRVDTTRLISDTCPLSPGMGL